MTIVPFLVSGKFALHFFPDKIVLTDDDCSKEFAVFPLSELDCKNFEEWFCAWKGKA